jgi:hypothetical protein
MREQSREGCTRIVLQQRMHDVEQLVREWTLDPVADPEILAGEVLRAATSEGKLLRGPTLYGVFSHRPGAESHSDRKFFRVEGTGGELDSLFREGTEIDSRSMVAQMLRHSEASARITLGQTLEIVEHYRAIVERQSARIAELEARERSRRRRDVARRSRPRRPAGASGPVIVNLPRSASK